MGLAFKLYLNRLLSSWGDRTWEFAIGLYLIKLNPSSLLLAAIQGILCSSATIIFAPIIGRWIETASRLFEAKLCLLIQNGCVVISTIFVALYFARDDFHNDIVQKVIEKIAPIALVFFSMIAQVFSIGYTLALEKDWLIALSSDEQELTNYNAMLRRIDLTCQTIAPFLVGILMQYSEFASAMFLMVWNFCSGFTEYAILKSIYYMKLDALSEPKKYCESNDFKLLDPIKKYKKDFLLPGLAFSLIYLNVLGFDSTAIAYLTNKGVREGSIGIVSLFGGIFGIFGTLVYQAFVETFDVKRAGLAGYLITLISLTLCLGSFFINTTIRLDWFQTELVIVLFLIGITVSRAGIWTVDLSVNQLIQKETPNPAVIGGVQASLNIVMELFKYTIVAFNHSIDNYWILIIISFSSISTGSLLFLFYTLQQVYQMKASCSKIKDDIKSKPKS